MIGLLPKAGAVAAALPDIGQQERGAT